MVGVRLGKHCEVIDKSIGFGEYPASNLETGMPQTKGVIQGERHDANEQDVKGKGKEEEVMFQHTESQQKESHRSMELDEEFRERMRKTLWAGGYSDAQIERMMTKAEGRAERPTYVKVHRKHLDPETLNTYELPWKWEDVSRCCCCTLNCKSC